jgi:large subunit ribosomal protein L10
MSKTERQAEVETITAAIKDSPNVYVTDFSGIDVAKMTEFRRRLRGAGAKYVVVKNTLAERALGSQGITALNEHLKGPIGLVLSKEPLAAAKVLTEFAKEFQKPGIRAGLVDGAAVSVAHIQRLGTIPDRQTLLGMIAGTMNNILASFAGCLEALREQRGSAS